MALTYKAFQEGIRIAPNNRTTDPLSGKVGEIYWNSTDSVLRICIDPAPIWTDAFVLPSGQLVPSLSVSGSTIRWDETGTPRWAENNQFLTLANRAYAPDDTTQGTDLELQAGNTTGGTNDGANLVLIGGSSLGGSQGRVLIDSDYIKSVIATGLAGRDLNVEAGDADTGSGLDGGDLNINGGNGDGVGADGRVLIGSLTEISVIDAVSQALLVENSAGRGIVIKSADYGISTPSETVDGVDSEDLVVSSGDVTGIGSISGDISIRSGLSNEQTGDIVIRSNNTGADDFNSGDSSLFTGSATGIGQSGDVFLFSGQTVNGKSGQVMIVTGNVSGSANSGDIVLLIGQSVGGARGNILISAPFVKTEDDTDDTESFNIKSGDASGFDPDVIQDQQLAVGGWFALQDWGTNEQYADSFVASASYVTQKISLTLRRVGSPVADLYVALVPDDGFGAPDESTILASATVDMSAITTNAAGEAIDFSISTSLVNSTTYYIMFYLSDPGAGTVDSSNYIDIQYVSTGLNGYWSDIPPDGTWTASGGLEGFGFEVYKLGAGKDSGNILIQTGAATGIRGQATINARLVEFNGLLKIKDGSEGTVGQVWKSTDTDGSGNWDEDTSLFIFPDSTILSGTYRGNVLVQGSSSVSGGAYFYGDLTVEGSLTSTDGSYIIVYGDLWVQEQIICNPTTGIAAGEIRVYRDMTVLDQLAAGTSVSMVSDEASADIYVDGSFFSGSDVILKPSDDATSPDGGNFYVGGNVVCDGTINISGGDSTGSADGGNSGEMIVQGHCTVNTILANGGDSVSGTAGASSNIIFESGSNVERLDLLVGSGTPPAATGELQIGGECRIADFRQTNMASAKIMPFLSTRPASLTIDSVTAKCSLYDSTGALFQDISLSADLEKLWRYDTNGDTWLAIGAGGGYNWVRKTANYTAVDNDGILADTASVGAFQINLPAAPATGTKVKIADTSSNFLTANLTVATTDSATFNGMVGPLVIDVNDAWVEFVFDSTIGANGNWAMLGPGVGGSGWSASIQVAAAGGGTNYTASSGDEIFTDTATNNDVMTITLPASAVLGDRIRITDAVGDWSNNNVTVNRNGHSINGSGSNFICDIDNSWVELVYINVAIGWKTLV